MSVTHLLLPTTLEDEPKDHDIIDLGVHLLAVVAAFAQRARQFYYAVALLGHRCPTCNGELTMAQEGRCVCLSCQTMFDPTVAFQHCSDCGGRPALRVRRYQCSRCGREIVSRFLFDGLVFDAEYFRRKMAEHRERSRLRHEQFSQWVAQNRSGELEPQSADLDDVPGLVEALNALTQGLQGPVALPPRVEFDLRRYQAHVQAHLGRDAVGLEEIPPLLDNPRLDRIWRFVAIILLAHARLVEVWQEGQTIMVIHRETHSER